MTDQKSAYMADQKIMMFTSLLRIHGIILRHKSSDFAEDGIALLAKMYKEDLQEAYEHGLLEGARQRYDAHPMGSQK